MALTLPPNFENDIQGRDTALVPVVQIGNLLQMIDDNDVVNFINSSTYLSTNSGSFTFAGHETEVPVVTKNYLPLLINIPSLKESIDIEKRNYKISSVNLYISNFPYEGQRFSELVGDTSLINTECRIYWVSPSTNLIHPQDSDYTSSGTIDNYAHAFQIYFGTIRRYTHDDDEVSLVVEDRSQTTFHKDLGIEPLEHDITKFYPLVYGEVDRSPTVQQTGDNNTISIHLDKDGSGSKPTGDYLYLHDNDRYANIPPSHSYLIDKYHFQTDMQYNATLSPYIEMEGAVVDHIEGEYFTPNSVLAINSVLISEETVSSKSSEGDNLVNAHVSTNDPWERQYLFQPAIGNRPDDMIIGTDIDGNDIIRVYGRAFINWKISFYYDWTDFSQSAQVFYYLGSGAGRIPLRNEGIGAGDTLGGGIAEEKIEIREDGEEAFYNSKLLAITSGVGNGYLTFNCVETGVLCHFYRDVVSLVKNANKIAYYAHVLGRESGSPHLTNIITNIMNEELEAGVDINIPSDPYTAWQYSFTINKKIGSKKLIEGIASASPYIPRFDNLGNFKFDVIKENYGATELNYTIKEQDVIDFSFFRTKIENVATKLEFLYNWDYAKKAFGSKRMLDIQDWACANNGTWESFEYYGLRDDHSDSTLVIDDDRGKYIRDNETAERFVCWMMSWYCNQHMIIKVKLPLSKGLEIEIGDIVNFDELLGGIAPYGINYVDANNDPPTFQQFYNYFMVTETNKGLDSVKISCIQMHKLASFIADYVDDNGNMFYGQ